MKKTILALILFSAFIAVKSQDVVEVNDLIVASDRSNCKCCPAPCCCKCAEISTPPVTTPPSDCVQKLDLVIIVDSSLSIFPNYGTQIAFLQNLVAEFDIGEDAVRVGMLQFSSNAVVEWTLNAYDDLSSLQTEIGNLTWMRGGTKTTQALDLAVSDLFIPPGDRPDVANVALVLTDGRPENVATLPSAAAALQSKARTVVVGITSKVNQETLEVIASDPDGDNIFKVDDFDELSGIINDLTTTICQTSEPQPPSVVRQCICCCPKPSPFGVHSGFGGYYGGGGCNCQ